MSRLTRSRDPRPLVPSRRRALFGLAAIASSALVAVDAGAQRGPALEPTPSQTEGPFYPKSFPVDVDNDLTRIVGRAARARGTVLYFGGRVLDTGGAPLAGAVVELWQCDALGRYHHAGDDGGPRDDNFQGYGRVTTTGEGRYAFTTIRPVPYSGRPAHLHVRVRPANSASLTTQVYIAGDRTDGDVVLGASPRGTLDRLSMSLAPASGREPGALTGSFDVVLRVAR
jgi:protocatechuate 3,4-dioxygenase, beta subunit